MDQENPRIATPKSNQKIQRHAVNSTNIVSVGYDTAGKTLDVEFYTGHLYRYKDVPQEVYDQLVQSTSVGSYFQQNIARKFTYIKLA